jgi:hypothetical protein
MARCSNSGGITQKRGVGGEVPQLPGKVDEGPHADLDGNELGSDVDSPAHKRQHVVTAPTGSTNTEGKVPQLVSRERLVSEDEHPVGECASDRDLSARGFSTRPADSPIVARGEERKTVAMAALVVVLVRVEELVERAERAISICAGHRELLHESARHRLPKHPTTGGASSSASSSSSSSTSSTTSSSREPLDGRRHVANRGR